jgi:ABC-type protease/lipase transport system fused ATPase/permease subunit
MPSAARFVRFAGRLALLGIVATVVAVIAMQLEGIVAKNVALSRELAASRSDIETFRSVTRAQRQTIVRLSDPHGAVPEIHEKLRLVGPHEELIYVRGLRASPQPGDWNAGR